MPSLSNKRVWVPVVAVVALILVAAGVIQLVRQARQPASDGKIQIVAAENFWGSVAQQIGGDRVQVTSIITDPNADPHLYESDARDAAAVSQARLVVENGLGYDDFIDKLLAAAPSSGRVVLSAQHVTGVSGSNPNPHLWYNSPYVTAVATAIEQQLAAEDPANRVTYQQNLMRFEASLQPWEAAIAAIKQKYAGAPVAYTERVPGYLLAAAGLSVKTPSGFAAAIEDGNEPSPADATSMDALMTNHQVRVLLYNAQTTSSVTQHVEDLARAAGIPVVGVTETLPANEPNFQQWQLNQARALLAALGG